MKENSCSWRPSIDLIYIGSCYDELGLVFSQYLRIHAVCNKIAHRQIGWLPT